MNREEMADLALKVAETLGGLLLKDAKAVLRTADSLIEAGHQVNLGNCRTALACWKIREAESDHQALGQVIGRPSPLGSLGSQATRDQSSPPER